jgi:hypothetical protein
MNPMEVLVRGKRVSRSARKLDLVLVAARYGGENSQLKVARGYRRRGFVWGDLELFDRQMLVEHLKAKTQVVTGRVADLPGDFEVTATVRMKDVEGVEFVVADGDQKGRDDLGVPLF